MELQRALMMSRRVEPTHEDVDAAGRDSMRSIIAALHAAGPDGKVRANRFEAALQFGRCCGSQIPDPGPPGQPVDFAAFEEAFFW